MKDLETRKGARNLTLATTPQESSVAVGAGRQDTMTKKKLTAFGTLLEGAKGGLREGVGYGSCFTAGLVLYAADTPNTWKVAAVLEYLQQPYEVVCMDIANNEQKVRDSAYDTQ